MSKLLWGKFSKKKFPIIFMAFVLIIQAIFSSTAFAAKPSRDRTPPTAPANLHAAAITDSTVYLAWNVSTDNVGVTGYEVYMNGVKLSFTTAASYLVTGLVPSKTYQFYVRAKDAAGNGSNSTILSVTTAISAVTVTPTPTPTAVPTSTPTPVPTAAPTSAPTPTPVPISGTKMIGYYAAWAAYSGYTPDKLDASKLTHINYAFANIGSDLKISLGYPDVDPSNISKLNALKQINPNLKTLISVGGWNWSGRFSDAALTEASRTTFADSCVAFIVKYGFDGVDIDWEYPVSGGLSTNIRRPEDKTNFTLLMQKIREKLDAQGVINGKHYLLSFAGAGDSWYLNNIEPGKIKAYVDYIQVMTYDIHGSWDTYTDFNAPLYDNSDKTPQYKGSVNSGISAWLNAGIPADKLIMGVPFYGYLYKAVTNANNGLYQTYSGSSSISYANIAGNYLNAAGYTRYFHSESLVPWLFNGTNFISYEDEQSMGYKAQYIKEKGLGGAMLWELSQDPDRVLLNSLYNGLK